MAGYKNLDALKQYQARAIPKRQPAEVQDVEFDVEYHAEKAAATDNGKHPPSVPPYTSESHALCEMTTPVEETPPPNPPKTVESSFTEPFRRR